MRSLVVIAAATTLGLAGMRADAATSNGFRYGVAAGEITSTSAVLWTRAPQPGPVVVALVGGPGEGTYLSRATRTNDLTVRLAVRGLRVGPAGELAEVLR